MQPTLYLVFLAKTTAFWIGRGFFAFLMICAVIKCLSIARRPETNAKSAVSLALFFSMILVNSFLGILTENDSAVTLVRLLLLVVILALGILSLVFAVIGLVEIKKEKGRYNQGRKQAIWAIVLCLTWFLIIGIIVSNKIDQNLGDFSDAQVNGTPAGENIDIDEFNIRFKAPEKPWVQVDAKKINPLSCLAFIRTKPHIFFLIIAEKSGVEANIDADTLAAVMKGNLESVSQRTKLIEEKPAEYGDLAGIQMKHDILINGKRVSIVQCAVEHNGYCYQLNTYGDLKLADEIEEQAIFMFDRFAQIDPDRIAPVVAGKPVTEFRSERFGYTVRFKDSGWGEWEELHDDFTEAEFGVQRQGTVCFAVVPVYLMGTDPDFEPLVHGLMNTLDIDCGSEDFDDERQISMGGADGKAFIYRRKIDGDAYLFKIRVLRKDGFAYLLASWVFEGYPDLLPLLDEALDSVAFAKEQDPVDTDRLSRREKNTHADILNRIGLFNFNNDRHEIATGYFKLAFGLNPENNVYLTNAVNAMSNQNRFSDALDHLEKHIEGFEEDDSVRSWKPFLLYRLGRHDESMGEYKRLFDGGYQHDSDFNDYMSMLEELERYDVAVAAMEKYLSGKETIDLHLRHASLYNRMGEYGSALRILDDLQKGRPFHSEIAYALDNNYYDADMYSESIEICTRLIEHGFDSSSTYYRKGRSEYELKWYRKAKQSLELALKKDPADDQIKRFLEHVSSVLGEGNNLLVKEVIEPVPIPVSIVSDAPADPPEEDLDDYSARYIRKCRMIQFTKGRGFKTTFNRRIRVLNTAGVQRFSTMEVYFDPLCEQVYVNELSVCDESGRKVAEGDINDYYVIDDTSSGTATHDKILNIPVSGLSPGSFIELTYTKRRNSRLDSFDYLEYVFTSSLPIVRSACYVTGDTDTLVYEASEGVGCREEKGGLLWSVDYPVTFRNEPYGQDYRRYLPMLWITDQGNTWEGMGREYLDDLHEHLALDGATKKLGAALVNDVDGECEKIRVLSRYVQDELTYKAIEFGRRARIPNSATQILENRYGDCKDHALLLHQLLKAAGLESQLTLVRTSGPVWSDFPSLEQFNHMIVRIGTPQGIYFVDCTDKETDPMTGIPYRRGGDTVLVLDPVAPRLETIADYPDDCYQVRSDRKMTLLENGDVKVEEVLEFTGYQASYMRYYFKGFEVVDRVRNFESWMKNSGATLELADMSVVDMDRLERPLIVKTDYTVRSRFQVMDDRLVGRVPCVWERYYISMARVEPRITPFELHFPVVVRSKSTLEIPRGWVLEELPPGAGSEEGDFARWSRTARRTDAGLEIENEYFIGRGLFPASRYSKIQVGADEALEALETNIVVRKK